MFTNSSNRLYKIILTALFVLIISSLIILSCKKENSITQSEEIAQLNLIKKNGGLILNDSKYGELILQQVEKKGYDSCRNLTYYAWIFDRYEPADGKVIGIWTYDNSIPYLKTLKDRWGYSGLWVDHDSTLYSNAISAGYDKKYLMVNLAHNLGDNNYHDYVNKYAAGYYYIDEVVEHDCTGNNGKRLYTPDELNEILNYIHSIRPESKFVISGYKRCSHLIQAATYADLIMYSSYVNWYKPVIPFYCNSRLSWGVKNELAWFEGNIDQRNSWSDMKRIFGDKFQRTWVKEDEASEFYQLFGHARNLNLNSIWIYDAGNAGKADNYELICTSAFLGGFLKKLEKKLALEFYCLNTDPCNCNIFSPKARVRYRIYETGERREVLP